jgi:hypothetical protein
VSLLRRKKGGILPYNSHLNTTVTFAPGEEKRLVALYCYLYAFWSLDNF